MPELVIAENTQVTLHFSLALENGDLIDSNFDGQAATFIIGDGSLLPGFEQKLLGLGVGTQATFDVKPEEGFGQPNDNNIQQVSRTSFAADMALEPGLVVSFADAAGGELPGVVKAIGDDEVAIDFNHPLAGRTITFRVEIVDIKGAQTH